MDAIFKKFEMANLPIERRSIGWIFWTPIFGELAAIVCYLCNVNFLLAVPTGLCWTSALAIGLWWLLLIIEHNFLEYI
jgi:hypothetical protein